MRTRRAPLAPSSRSLRLVGSLLVALSALPGCIAPVDDAADPLGAAAQPIMGGKADSGDLGVVDVVWNQGQGAAFCTGSLLAPNMVLTAHHCVSNVLPANAVGVSCGTSSFSAPDSAGNFYVSTKEVLDLQNIPANAFHVVKEVVLPPGNGSKFCGIDQAILILSDEVSPSEAVPLVPRVDVPLAAQEPYTAIGFGITSDGATDNGTRRRLDGLAVGCVGGGCAQTYGNAINTQHEWGGDHGTCEGDSGGPAIDKLGRVVGVTSRGGAGCSLPIYGDVYSWGSWIKQTAVHAASVGGYTAPLWATGWPTDPAFSDPVGGACNDPKTCPSGLCLADDGGSYCTRTCETAAPCPTGYACNMVQGQALCQRPAPATKPPPTAAMPTAKSGCSLPAGSPTQPASHALGLAVGALALLRRRAASTKA